MTGPTTQTDLRAPIERAITEHPRSQQVEIGPSEIGTPCARKLGFKIANVPPASRQIPNWRATVGTATHTWADRVFQAENIRLGRERWLTETSIWIADYDGDRRTLAGHSDLFDTDTGTSIDWKFPGVTTIKNARKAKSPGHTYRVQGHAYGIGYQNLGLEVRHVAVYFLPAAGELADGYYWTEPFDPAVALEAIARLDAVTAAIRLAGASTVIPTLPLADDHCNRCEWWQPNPTDLAVACPGAVTQSFAAMPANPGPAFGEVGAPQTPEGAHV